MLSDPIADMLTRIRNAILCKHRYVDVNFSKINLSILSVFEESGFIFNFLTNDELRKIRVFLRYDRERESVITNLKRLSKPGRRKYSKWFDVPIFRRGLGISVVSTSKGMISGKKAKEEKVGGELICSIW